MKTNKSFSKRLKVTRKGKILSRKAGKNHYNAKSSRSKQLSGNRDQEQTMKRAIISQNMPQSAKFI